MREFRRFNKKEIWNQKELECSWLFIVDMPILKLYWNSKLHCKAEDDIGKFLKGLALAQDLKNGRIGEKQD